MTELTAERMQAAAADYADRAPFFAVEADRLETLPAAFANGSYLWKDAEWVVRWYCRRPLETGVREPEEAFRNNDMTAIRDAIAAARASVDVVDAVNGLIALDGVDVQIASAFLQFMAPERYVVVTEPTWSVLFDDGRLHHPWPDPLTPSDYERFLDGCGSLADRIDLTLIEVDRALCQCAGVWE